jgi:hypothetical protein
MTTVELLGALVRGCPNGVSFDPMALRLLRQKVPFEDWQIEDMKAAMFQLGSGLWFSREMVLDAESRLAFEEQAMQWTIEYGCFSVERLFRKFCDGFSHIATAQDCAAFLGHLGFTVAVWNEGGYFCSHPPPVLDGSLAAISETIAGWIEEAEGTLAFDEIEQALPHLTTEALESIRVNFLKDIHGAKVGEVCCWRSNDSITLPEDFSEKLTTVVDTLAALDMNVTTARLEFALNLFYCKHFRTEHDLLENEIFVTACERHYEGQNTLFSDKKKSRKKESQRFRTSGVGGARAEWQIETGGSSA